MTEYGVILVTVSDSQAAEIIARGLLENKLAACCNVIGGVRSFYWWQGQIQNDQEVLLVIKSRAELFDKIKETVLALHAYTVPEIILLPVSAGNESYLNWIDQSLAH